MGRSRTTLRWGVAVVALVGAGVVVATALVVPDGSAPAPIEVAAATDLGAPDGELREIQPTRVLTYGADPTTGTGASPADEAAVATPGGATPGDAGAGDDLDGLVPTVPGLPGEPEVTVPTTTPSLLDLLPPLPLLSPTTTTTTSPPALPLPTLPALPLPLPLPLPVP